jgi:acyl dehydratase
MQFGRTYEEFEVGAVYKHWPGKTVTEYDDHLFCLLTRCSAGPATATMLRTGT